jgi:hypothetical protein
LILAYTNSKHSREYTLCLDGVKRVVGVVDWHLMGFIEGDFPEWDENWQELTRKEHLEPEKQDRIRYAC